MRNPRFLCLVILIGAACMSPAWGSILYGTANEDPGSIKAEDLFLLDQVTGEATLIGSTNFSAPLDLASDWRVDSFRLWAPDDTSNQLLLLDPGAGAAQVVGPFGSDSHIRSLAFDVRTQRMFGCAQDDHLYEIDPVTGQATHVADLGFGDVFALTFDLAGRLLAVSSEEDVLLEIDPDTGTPTVIVDVSLQAITDMAARPEDGVMFVVDTPTDALYTLDLDTGQATLVGPYDAGVNYMVGLAFSPIPEPATLGLLVGGLLVLRRRRRK